MLETKEQKQYFFSAVVLVLILSIVSACSRPNFRLANQGRQANQNSIEQSKKYLEYLRSIPVDKEASKQLFQTILTEEDVKKEVEQVLGASQKAQMPQISDSDLVIVKDKGEAAVTDYLSKTVSAAMDFNTRTADLSQAIFTEDKSPVVSLRGQYENFYEKLAKTPVPQEMLGMHKSLLSGFYAYGELLNTAQNYNPSDLEATSTWTQVYQSYLVANQSTLNYTDELLRVTDKYKIASIPVTTHLAEGQEAPAKSVLVKEANAFLGLTWSLTIGDIPRLIMDAVKEGLRTAFLQFMGLMLNKLIQKIEQSYLVANFLYYSDALLSGQYVNDFLNKYVNDPLDQNVVKKFIPQFTCGQQPQDLKPVFQAKAQEYLGFLPDELDPKDPDYYLKMSKVGDFLASPTGWKIYYEDVASQTKSEAEKAAEKELTSTGLKTPRDAVKSSIGTSISNIVSAQRASFTAMLQMGLNNADSIISSFVSQLTQTLVNRFVFRGVTSNNGSLVVLKEQPTCVSAALTDPILPLTDTDYNTPAAPPTPEDMVAIQCSQYSSINTDCTNSVMDYLQKCASGGGDTANCNKVRNSPYVNAKLSQCNAQAEATGLTPNDCLRLKNLLNQFR
jgi:hypothetical protein